MELTRNSAPLSLVQRPRRLALFAFVALSPDQMQSRDILQAMFWPECDQDEARRSLNSALYAVRQELGADTVVSRGSDTVLLPPDRVWCDVKAFKEAIRAEDHAAALELHRGDLMPGFFIRGAPEFERWLDDERSWLRRAAHSAAWKRAERAEQEGNRVDAVEWARRAVQVSLDDEVLVQRSMRLLDRIGDRVGAIEVFERFARYLKEEYDAAPTPETQRLIADVRTRIEPRAPESMEGRALLLSQESPAPVPALALPIDPIGHLSNVSVSAGSGRGSFSIGRPVKRRFQVWSRAGIGAIAGVTLLVASGAILLARAGMANRNPGTLDRPGIVVSPFENVGPDSDQAFLAPAITAAVTQQLAQVSTIDLMSIDAFATQNPSAAGWAPPERNKVVFLIRGKVLPLADRIRVAVELIDLNSGDIVKTAKLERPRERLFNLIDDVGREVGTLLRSELGRAIQLRRWRAATTNVRAWELLYRAEVDRQWAKELEKNGSYAAAVTGFTKADSILSMAEREAPEWVDPTAWRVRVASDVAWLLFLPPLNDTVAARAWIRNGVAYAERVLRRDSANAAVYELRGTLHYWSSLMPNGGPSAAQASISQAERDLRTAVSADANLPRAWSLLSVLLRARGDFVNAYWAAQHAYATDAYLETREETLVRLALTAYEIGNDSLAWEWCSAMDARTSSGAYCRLNLLAWIEMPGERVPVDPWVVAAPMPRDDAGSANSTRPRLKMLVATVLARRGLADSARAVSALARLRQPDDDELLLLEAGVRVALGEKENAARLLRHYINVDPAHRLGAIRSRRFQSIKDLLSAVGSTTVQF